MLRKISIAIRFLRRLTCAPSKTRCQHRSHRAQTKVANAASAACSETVLPTQNVYEIGTASCPRNRLFSTLKRGSKCVLQLSVRILRAGDGQVKFKLFMAGIIEFRRKNYTQLCRSGSHCCSKIPQLRSAGGANRSVIGNQREALLTTWLRMMASAISFMGLRRCWLWRWRIR